MSIPAQVVEISLSGVLLVSKRAMSVGERGTLRATFGSRALDVAIQIRSVAREQPPHGDAHYRIGAVFDMSPEQRVVLADLLGVERN